MFAPPFNFEFFLDGYLVVILQTICMICNGKRAIQPYTLKKQHWENGMKSMYTLFGEECNL